MARGDGSTERNPEWSILAVYYLKTQSAGDVEFVHDDIDLLDHEIQVLSAGQGFVFVQPNAGAWSPHTICGPGSRSWFVPVTLAAALTGHSATFFHPTAQGQEELFEEVEPYAR